VKLTLAALTLALSAPALAAPKEEIPVDRLAAAVGGEVLLASEVELEARLALIKKGGERALDIPIDDKLRARVLDQLLLETLVYSEARRLRLVDGADAARLALYRGQLEREHGAALKTALARFAVTEAAFGEYVKRRYYAERLLAERLDTPPTEEELEGYYESNRDEFGGRSFAEARDDVAARAKEGLAQRRLSKYLDELRSRFPVRIMLPAARAP
jgi:hypothetical protein